MQTDNKIKNNIQAMNVGDYNRIVNNVNRTEREQIAEFNGYLEDAIYWELFMILMEMALMQKIYTLSETIVRIKDEANNRI